MGQSLFLLHCIFYVKKLKVFKLKLSSFKFLVLAYSFSIRQKLIFKIINPKYFHRIYFDFEEKKLTVKALFIKPLLPSGRTLYLLLISIVAIISEARCTVSVIYIGISCPQTITSLPFV